MGRAPMNQSTVLMSQRAISISVPTLMLSSLPLSLPLPISAPLGFQETLGSKCGHELLCGLCDLTVLGEVASLKFLT